MTPSMLIMKARRRLWQPHLVVLLTSIGWCVLHLTTHHSSIIISWLPVHRRIRAMAPPPTVLRPPSQKLGIVPHTCYNYGIVGHFIKVCMAPRQMDMPRPQSHSSHPPRVVAKTGRVNYTTMKDVPEGRHVLMGRFSLNGHHIIILFDSSVTHDFISKAYTQTHKLAVKSINTPYMIRTPGGNVFTKQLAVSTLST
jgi:hypothetical protein